MTRSFYEVHSLLHIEKCFYILRLNSKIAFNSAVLLEEFGKTSNKKDYIGKLLKQKHNSFL